MSSSHTLYRYNMNTAKLRAKLGKRRRQLLVQRGVSIALQTLTKLEARQAEAWEECLSTHGSGSSEQLVWSGNTSVSPSLKSLLLKRNEETIKKVVEDVVLNILF